MADAPDPRLEINRLKSLVELSARLADCKAGLDEKLQNCVEVLAGLTGAEKVSLMLVEDDYLVVRAASNHELIGLSTALNQASISTAVVGSRSPVYTKEVGDTSYHQVSRQGDLSNYRTGSLISLPLLEEDQVIGVLNLSDKKDKVYFDETDLETALGVAYQMAGQLHFSAMHSRLDRAFKEMEASQQAKEDLMYLVFHDMKAPLTGVKEILNLLAEPAAGPEVDTAQLLDLAQNDLELLWRRITNLLDLSRLDGPGLPMNPVPLDLAALAAESLGRLVGICRVNQVMVDLKAPQAVMVHLDEDLVERILVNLLVNAIRAASPESGGGGWVELELAEREGSALVWVQDTGPGLDPGLGDSVFDRYIQGQKSKGSSGLGLYFCRRAARLMGGEVSYRNLSEGGACFELRLPLSQG